MSVMCADAKTRGVACVEQSPWCALPCVPNLQLKDYYTHILEWASKVKADLKAAGSWLADPRESTCGRVAEVAAPSLGVEASNLAKVRGSWHRWNADTAPMPNGTTALWREKLGEDHFMLCDDKAVLWDPDSWIWDNPTWLISGVSTQKMKQAL